jgi:hypothetical protein
LQNARADLRDRGEAGISALPVFIRLRVRSVMTNRLAIVLGLILIIAITVDVMMYGSEHVIFLGKKLFELIEWIAFWR